jgi:hypothetical protein
MRLRIAEVHEESITEQLSDMPIVALNNVRTHPLILAHHVTPVFRVELRGESGGIDQVTEHHCELPSFRVGRRRWRSREKFNLRGWLFLDSRRLCCVSKLRGNCLSACCVTSPNETSSFVIDNWVNIEDFVLQIVEIVVIEVKSSFESTIRYPSLAFEKVNDLGEHLIEGHR